MGKYDPLGTYLARQPGREVRVTFAEVEAVLGFQLPASARTYRPWWSPMLNAINFWLATIGTAVMFVDLLAAGGSAGGLGHVEDGAGHARARRIRGAKPTAP